MKIIAPWLRTKRSYCKFITRDNGKVKNNELVGTYNYQFDQYYNSNTNSKLNNGATDGKQNKSGKLLQKANDNSTRTNSSHIYNSANELQKQKITDEKKLRKSTSDEKLNKEVVGDHMKTISKTTEQPAMATEEESKELTENIDATKELVRSNEKEHVGQENKSLSKEFYSFLNMGKQATTKSQINLHEIQSDDKSDIYEKAEVVTSTHIPLLNSTEKGKNGESKIPDTSQEFASSDFTEILKYEEFDSSC